MKLTVGQLVTHANRWDYKLGLVTEILHTEDKIPLYVVFWVQRAQQEPRTVWHMEDELSTLEHTSVNKRRL